MGRHKYGNAKDRNHTEIEDAFKALGFTVKDISNLPNAFDIIVAKNGHTVCVEIKDPLKPPSGRRLTNGEKAFSLMWVYGGNWRKVETLEDVQEINKAIMKKGNGFL